jgi:Multicopper oxidase
MIRTCIRLVAVVALAACSESSMLGPYEAGWKDTVLVMPLKNVEVLVAFDHYRGIYPLHCHNLQREDMGMMLNVEVMSRGGIKAWTSTCPILPISAQVTVRPNHRHG